MTIDHELLATTLRTRGVTLHFKDPDAPALSGKPTLMTGQTIVRPRHRHSQACPQCGKAMIAKREVRGNHPRATSIDHILPQQRGSASVIHALGVRNTVIVCRECNGLRAGAGHCWAALACVRAVAEIDLRSPIDIMRDWGFGTLVNMEAERYLAARAADEPPEEWSLDQVDACLDDDAAKRHANGSKVKHRRPEVETAMRAEQRRLQVEAAMSRVPDGEFTWPADTAAQQVWNLATLARWAGVSEHCGSPGG